MRGIIQVKAVGATREQAQTKTDPQKYKHAYTRARATKRSGQTSLDENDRSPLPTPPAGRASQRSRRCRCTGL